VSRPAPAPTTAGWTTTLDLDFAEDAGGFYVGEYAHGRWIHEDGTYFLDVSSEDWVLWATQGHAADLHLAVDVIPWSGRGSGGLVFRGHADAATFYSFRVSTDGYFTLDAAMGYEREEVVWKEIIPWRKSPHIRVGGTPNRLEVIAIDDQITLSINGETVHTLHDDTLTAGAIGLAAQHFVGHGARFGFDNLTLRQPDADRLAPNQTEEPRIKSRLEQYGD
jgi:hypothetical protein